MTNGKDSKVYIQANEATTTNVTPRTKTKRTNCKVGIRQCTGKWFYICAWNYFLYSSVVFVIFLSFLGNTFVRFSERFPLNKWPFAINCISFNLESFFHCSYYPLIHYLNLSTTCISFRCAYHREIFASFIIEKSNESVQTYFNKTYHKMEQNDC